MFGDMNYKILFWISIVMLLVTNLFWFYQVLDTSIGHSYYKTSCEEYKKDVDQLRKVTDSLTTKTEVLQFLLDNKMEVDTLQKGDDFHVNFKSFRLSFDRQGERFEY
jgi:hypothetical protein